MAKSSESRSQKSGVRSPESGVQSGESGIQNRETGVQSRESEKQKANQVPKPTASSPINKEFKKELQKQQKIFQQLEEKVGLLTKQKAELEAALTDPATYSDKQKFLQAEAAYNKASAELELLNKQYEQVFEKIMELEARERD